MAEKVDNQPASAPQLSQAVSEKFKVAPGFGAGEISFKGKTVFLNLATLPEVEDLVKSGYKGLEPVSKK